MNYLVVLFKNKTKKKIINKFKTHKRAKEFFDSILNTNKSVIFDKKYENGYKCTFEVALIEKTSGTLLPVFLKDTLGRNLKVKLDSEDYTITKIDEYKEEEFILDYSNSEKITTQQLIQRYLDSDGFKLISKLNNKIVIQNDDNFNLFTLKNEEDSSRFIDYMSDYFMSIGRTDCMMVKDYSTQQRKYLYNLLIDKGFPKNYLIRRSTTHPIKT